MPTLENIPQSYLVIALSILLVIVLILVVMIVLAFRKPNANNSKDLSRYLREQFDQFHKSVAKPKPEETEFVSLQAESTLNPKPRLTLAQIKQKSEK